jgi:hypothetical protein
VTSSENIVNTDAEDGIFAALEKDLGKAGLSVASKPALFEITLGFQSQAPGLRFV